MAAVSVYPVFLDENGYTESGAYYGVDLPLFEVVIDADADDCRWVRAKTPEDAAISLGHTYDAAASATEPFG